MADFALQKVSWTAVRVPVVGRKRWWSYLELMGRGFYYVIHYACTADGVRKGGWEEVETGFGFMRLGKGMAKESWARKLGTGWRNGLGKGLRKGLGDGDSGQRLGKGSGKGLGRLMWGTQGSRA